MESRIVLPQTWVSAGRLEAALRSGPSPHDRQVYTAEFRFPVGCKVMIDTAVRLLSLVNQLALSTKTVRLQFDEGEQGTMGYLNRMGFFDHLIDAVEVLPHRPAHSGARTFRGGNTGLVEIARINKDQRDEKLPSRLADTLQRACRRRADSSELGGAAWTIFAELVDNVFCHSRTPLDGYAALQVYPQGDRLTVAVSDSGLGIMDTLRPALVSEYPRLTGLSDLQLLVEIFRQGISRHGPDRGCGLKGSAAKAMKFKAELDVRLPSQRVLLTPSTDGYQPSVTHCYDGLPLMWGTHISFAFKLGA